MGKKRNQNAAAAAPKRQSKQQGKPWINLSSLSINQVAVCSLLLICFFHLGGLLLFTRGFLLNRVTLDTRTRCPDGSCTMKPKFKRAIILLIDALRYDFIFPISPSNPDYNSHHHNVFQTPAKISKAQPENSVMFRFVADPPTTTLQRLKGLTTGTLPTFIDVGSNFAGSQVEEDNWLDQAKANGKKIAFIGDDTWLSTFSPQTFDFSAPYDSFNVEDLDTVDRGVVDHLLPLLRAENSTSWDILIGHMLGLDHAGHRVGTGHPEMHRKLQEADDFVNKILPQLREDDLFILMGDHGMDSKGDHGGDSPDEINAGIWMYSKTPLVPSNVLDTAIASNSDVNLAKILDPEETFHIDQHVYRSIPQISLVPTLSLLLGLPIPFNNLGQIIPELFMSTESSSWFSRKSETSLAEAIRLNADQIMTYLRAYSSGSGGQELQPFMASLEHLYRPPKESGSPAEEIAGLRHFMGATLQHTRAIWAQFNPVLMGLGLAILFGALVSCIRLFRLSRIDGSLWKEGGTRRVLSQATAGAVFGLLGSIILRLAVYLAPIPVTGSNEIPSLIQTAISGICLGAEVAIITPMFSFKRSNVSNTFPLSSVIESLAGIALAILHSTIFASNSFTIWEDYIVLLLLQIPIAIQFLRSFFVPDARVKGRLPIFTAAIFLLLRLTSVSTICREEQHPMCKETFYSLVSGEYRVFGIQIIPRNAVILLAGMCGSQLSAIIERFLKTAKSYRMYAPYYLAGMRILLLAGVMYWALDHFSSLSPENYWLPFGKTLIARIVFGVCLVTAGPVWHYTPLCITMQKEEVVAGDGAKGVRLTIIGFANSMGSIYLLFYLPVFALLFLLAQTTGQIVLAMIMATLLCFVEAVDLRRDVRQAELASKKVKSTSELVDLQVNAKMDDIENPSILDIVMLAMLGYHTFFTTGHQGAISSIQWKTAFVGFSKLIYPISPLLVILNTLGPFILSALAVPLLVFWNITPTIKDGPTLPILTRLFNASTIFMAYHTLITLSSTFFAAYFRRHLMVWKIFAPRFMLSGVVLLAVDVALVGLGVAWAGLGVLRKCHWTFKTAVS